MEEVPHLRLCGIPFRRNPFRRASLFLGMTFTLAALSLQGCGSTVLPGVTREADQRAAAIFADCNAQLAAGQLKSYREAVECARPKVITVYQEAAYPFMDLVTFDLEERRIGAEKIDLGQAQPDAVARDLAVLEERLKAERDRRYAARSGFGGEASPVTVGQMLAGLTTLQERQIPAASAACFSLGNEKHCD